MEHPAQTPTVAFYCATFLKPEMHHIYRQITALERVQSLVVAQKRENEAPFPFDNIEIVPRPKTHFLRRFWFRQLRDKPWQISDGELRRLTTVLTAHNARLLQIFFGHIAVHLLPLLRSWPHPCIVSFHGADVLVDMDKPAYRAKTKEVLDAVACILARSESLARAVAELGADPKKVQVVRTGIPLGKFPFQARNFPNDGEWRFVQACRLIEKKGPATTLHAFTNFLREYPAARLTIAGEGPLLEELRTLAQKLRIADHLSFPGFLSQEELLRLYDDSHIFIHPSETGGDGNQEGIPNSMLEAMATGLPVFATRHGGIPEAIEDGVSGILVAERDQEALTNALLQAVQDPSQLARLARNGSQVVRQKFDQQTQVQRLEEIYLALAGAA